MSIRSSLMTVAALTALGLTSVCPVSGQAGTSPPPAGQPPAPPMPPAAANIPEDQLLEAYGWFLGQQFELYALGFSEGELAAISRGIALAASGKRPERDLAEVGPALQQFITTRQNNAQERRLAEGRAEEAKLFAELDKKESVKKTQTGLRYEITAEGKTPKPTLSDTIVAHYKGTFVDGTVFDSTAERKEPAEFKLNAVIPGWQEGLQLVGTGGRIKLYVPSNLGYGDYGRMTIPPGKALIFEVELVAVKAEQPQLVPQQPKPPGP